MESATKPVQAKGGQQASPAKSKQESAVEESRPKHVGSAGPDSSREAGAVPDGGLSPVISSPQHGEGRRRVVIERVEPDLDGGRFPIKRIVGERVDVEADLFTDGHDSPSAVLRFRHEGEPEWRELPMQALGNDRFRAEFTVRSIGRYYYTVAAWVDHFRTWRRDLKKRVAAQQNVDVDLQIGSLMIEEAVGQAKTSDADRRLLQQWNSRLRSPDARHHLAQICDDAELDRLMDRCAPRKFASEADCVRAVTVDRERARFSAWYEMFPRSAADEPGRHGTLQDVVKRLPYVAQMGFNVLYLPPIHPIGQTHRKGKNNNPVGQPEDVGSPWGIGGAEGGHKSVHPELGTMTDFEQLVQSARQMGIELAMDVAFQCSPDHPYVRDHSDWFRRRPDGTIQYAENPPKKYEDIYPFDFETDDWRNQWEELKSVFTFWIERGVRIFRVDNPHTKPFPFWEWAIGEIKREWPDVLFLAEAFTRPKVMYRLAKLGFSQSYTYFTWRNSPDELREYVTELTQTEARDFFRPNFWPNTPDILTETLQVGGRPAFISRLVLAATLCGNYGIYGPAFEHMVNRPRDPGSEEYLDSEKYEVKHWDIRRPDSLAPLIGRVNRIRREHTSLQSNDGICFHSSDNPKLLCYTRQTDDNSELLMIVVNLDSHHTQAGWIELPLADFGLTDDHPYQLHDLLTDARYVWQGAKNYVELNPHVVPAHIFRVRRRVRSEQDFEYYL